MPSSITAQSLLSLPPEVTRPSPYSVFGLSPGESDERVITQAIAATVKRLNAAKPTADPAAWQQAAVWVKRARGILLDPALKARLDGATLPAEADSASGASAAAPRPAGFLSPGEGAAEDPLAGLLPGGGAAASAAPIFRAGPARFSAGDAPPASEEGLLGPSAPLPPEFGPPPSVPPINRPPPTDIPATGAGMPASAAGAATQRPSSTASAELLPGQMPVPIQIQNNDLSAARRRRRRSGFPWAAVLLSLLTVICVGGIVGLIYVLDQNPGGIVLSLQSGPETGVGTPAAVRDRRPEPTAARRPPADPVMGRLGPPQDRSSGRNRDNTEAMAAADDWLAGLADPADESMPSPAAMSMPGDAAAAQDTVTAEPSAASDAALQSPPRRASEDELPSMAGDEAAQAAIAKAREAIAAANWTEMQSVAEAAERAAVTPGQKAQASHLFQLAELASYYHGAVEMGLDGLEAGESFDVTEQLQIVVVEIGEEDVVFRFSGRNKQYPRRELPLVLAHKIARFALPAEAPTTTAAANAYQAVAPISTPQYREQAIGALEAMTEEVEGADSAEVAAAIRDVFAE